MKKRIAYALLCMAIVMEVNSQGTKFGWSLGNFGWSYNFTEAYHIFDLEFLRFNVSFEQINLTISPSVFMGAINTGRKNTETLYYSFLPLEIAYSPFKGEYADISLYGRGAWEFAYVKGMDHSGATPGAFGGALGLRLGIIPLQADRLKYAFHVVTLFSEYTTRREFKLGINIDLLEVFLLVFLSYT